MMPLFAATFWSNPFTILCASVAFIVVAIAVLRLHAFFALLLAGCLAGLLTTLGTPEPDFAKAVERVMTEMGGTVGQIGFPIAVAVVIGAALMESGAADKIVRRAVAVFGEKRAPLALLISGFVLGIPVFFDTVFFLLVPLARALALRTGRNYVLYLLAISAGGLITHVSVPPTPGPLVVAGLLHIDLGVSILAGLVTGILPAAGGLMIAAWIDRRMPIAVRPSDGSTLDSVAAMARREESELPGFVAAISPVVVPVVLIAAAAFAGMFKAHLAPGLVQTLAFLGNKNVAMFLGGILAVTTYLRQRNLGWTKTGGVVAEPLTTGGVIILITAAGGAYGAMIRDSGLGEAVRAFSGDGGLNYVLLVWVLAVVVRVAQGSATVAMITAAGIVASLDIGQGLGVHPVWLALSAGYGSLFLSWMNDSGFWVFSRMSGLNEGETLRTWTVLLTAISVLGLVEILLLSRLLPFAGH